VRSGRTVYTGFRHQQNLTLKTHLALKGTEVLSSRHHYFQVIGRICHQYGRLFDAQPAHCIVSAHLDDVDAKGLRKDLGPIQLRSIMFSKAGKNVSDSRVDELHIRQGWFGRTRQSCLWPSRE
jgi:hypothetical protein